MRFRLAAILLVLCGPLAVAEQSPPPRALNAATFGQAVEVNVVNVDVAVTDSSGQPVTGLEKKDFELFEDGKRVEISHFDAVEGNLSRSAQAKGSPEGAAPEDAWTLVVYVDNFDLHPGNRTRALRQLRGTLGRLLAPGDRVMLVTYDLGFQIQLPFTSDAAAIDAALAKMEGLTVRGASTDDQRRQAVSQILTIQEAALSDPQPRACPLSIAKPAHDFAAARRDEVLRSLGALTVLVNSLSGVPGRKAVLHVSDGLPSMPGDEVFQFLAELCGGGSGTGGIGRQGPNRQSATEGPGNATEPWQPGDPGHPTPRETAPLDAGTVYDARLLGPGAYQAASQAPIDASTYSVAKDLQALVAHANAQRVTLYTLQASGAERPEASEGAMGAGDRLAQFPSIEAAQRASLQGSLTVLASGTGGRAILDVNQLGPDLRRMRDDFSTYYSLGFTPEHGGDGREHRLEVKVKRRGAQLRYRESYRDKPVLEKAVDRTLAALLYGVEENPLHVSLEVGEQTPGAAGTMAVPVHLSIPLSKVGIVDQDNLYKGALRVLVAVRGADGQPSLVRQIAVPIQIPRKQALSALGQLYVYTLTLQLPPGEQRIAVGVRDDFASTASYLSRAVTVGPAPANTR